MPSMVAPPEVVQRVIETYQRAAEANRQTAAREGNVIALPALDQADVLVAADLHGNRINFGKLLDAAALDHHPHRHLVMQEVCHGGPLYPSGQGCMSHLLLEDVAQLKVRYPERLHFLMSNHELSEVTNYPITKANRMLNLLFRCGLQEMYGNAAEQVRVASLEFLGSCPLAVRTQHRVFICHSLPEEVDEQGFDAAVFQRPLASEDFRAGGPVFQLVWGRDHRRDNALAFARLVDADVLIHGHEPCPDGFFAPNDVQVILDCCGAKACYLLLPLHELLTHRQVVQRVTRLS